MKRNILVLLVLFISVQSLSAHNIVQRKFNDGRMFHYKISSSVLYATYEDNASSLAWLDRVMASNRVAVLSGQAHVEIFGYIPTYEVGDANSINKASVQGSVLRAYLKTQYGIPHSRVVFAIDTTQGFRNVARLELVSGEVPKYANTQISYTQSSSWQKINEAVSDYYGGVPYTSYEMHVAKRDLSVGSEGELYSLSDGALQQVEEEDSFDDFVEVATKWEVAQMSGMELYVKTQQGDFIPATVKDINDGIKILYSVSGDGDFEFASLDAIISAAQAAYSSLPEGSYLDCFDADGALTSGPYVQLSHRLQEDAATDAQMQIPHYISRPGFAIKTNALYWGAAVPNLELELFLGSRFSLAAEGVITKLTPLLSNHEVYEGWGASGEVRVWLGQANKFNGFYLGLYGSMGEFDYKFGKNGNKGDFYSFGLSLGWHVPLSDNFGFEFGLAGGYLYNTNKEYHWDGAQFAPTNVAQPIRYQHRIFPTKAKFSLVWRLCNSTYTYR